MKPQASHQLPMVASALSRDIFGQLLWLNDVLVSSEYTTVKQPATKLKNGQLFPLMGLGTHPPAQPVMGLQ